MSDFHNISLLDLLFERLELHIQVRLKDLIFSQWVKGKRVARAARSEIAIDLSAVTVGEVEDNRVADRITAPHREALQVDAAVVKVRINQVRIDRELLDVLVEGLQLPVVLRLNFPNAKTDLIRVALISFVRVPGGGGTLVALEVRREVAENTHGDFADLPAKFRRHVKN